MKVIAWNAAAKAFQEDKIEKKFDEERVRDRMRLIKQKFLASMLERRASLRGANTNTQTQETNTRGTSLQPVANTNSLTDNTHDQHNLTHPTTLPTVETTRTRVRTKVQKDSEPNPSSNNTKAPSNDQSSQLMSLLASQGPQVFSILCFLLASISRSLGA